MRRRYISHSLPPGRSIPANGSCSVSVSVTSAAAGSYLNTLPVGALQTSNGGNTAPALATLLVTAQVMPAVVAVPTLSSYLLGLLCALLAVAGLTVIRKRSS